MARTGWGKAGYTITSGSNDASKIISKDRWNLPLNKGAGILGFDAQTVASASTITPNRSVVVISGSTEVTKFLIADSEEYDILYVFKASGASASLTNTTGTPSADGQIVGLDSASTITLSETIPKIFIRKSNGTYQIWSEYGGGTVGDGAITFAKIQDIATMKVIGRTAGGSGVSSEVALLDEDNMASDSATSLATQQSIKKYVDDNVSSVTASSTTTFTNKTIDADGTGNSITNIEDANIKVSAGIDAQKIADGSVSSTEFQYLDGLSQDIQTSLDAKQSTTLASAKLLVGNGSGVATAQTITGDIAIDNAGATTIQTDAVDIAMLSATGTASSTTFLRGDNTWATAGGGAENTVDTKLRDEADTVPTYTSRTENDASTPIQLWAITLDSNNENIYVRVKKNGSYTNVQIA